MSQVWSWVLAGLGASALFVAGRRPTVGWALSLLVVQPAWLVYGIVSRQWGFLASVALYGSVFGRNWWIARRKAEVPSAAGSPHQDHVG